MNSAGEGYLEQNSIKKACKSIDLQAFNHF